MGPKQLIMLLKLANTAFQQLIFVNFNQNEVQQLIFGASIGVKVQLGVVRSPNPINTSTEEERAKS